MTAFVLDASIAACWAFPDESHPTAADALVRLGEDEAHVPTLWWFEVRNMLVVGERRGRLTERQVTLFLRELADIDALVDERPEEAAVLRLARTHRLSVYDAAYLELAQRNGVALATLDRQLAAAARAELVPLVGEDA